MAHNRITVSEYDEDTGVSVVVKSSKFGEATGMAFCHPGDEDVKSMFTGSRIAEHRADTMLKQMKATNYAARVQGVEHLESVLNEKLDHMLTKDGNDEHKAAYDEIREFVHKQVGIAKWDAKIAHDTYLSFKKYDKEYAETLVKQKREFREKHPIE